jgi:hypothetical protein
MISSLDSVLGKEVMMLAPDQRELLLDALRPPEGYYFDRGIGTTFSLDLLTLLIAPLSLVLLDVSDSEAALSDPVLLLEGVRHYADRLTIFCQAGRIAIPPPDYYLYSFLENSVVEVRAPRGGVFHPKVWLLRYLAQQEGLPPLYRLLNLSRNLTFDKSWDLMVRLEGTLVTHRHRAYARNNPLGDFVRILPELAVHPVDPRIVDDVDRLQSEVRRVVFRVPEPFEDSLAFYPFGIPGYYYRDSIFDENRWRTMVVSPFLDDRLLQHMTEQGGGHILVSREDSIATLKPETLACFERLYALDESGTAEAEQESETTEDVGGEVDGVRTEPSGLHAKLFITEAGWDATWLLGSANATSAAFMNRNVEFMVRLQGRRSRVGIDKVLGEEEDDNAIRALLRTYTPQAGVVEVNEKQKRAEASANRVRDWLIGLPMRLEVIQQDTGQFDLLLKCEHADTAALDGEYIVKCWPVTLRPERGMTLEPTPLLVSLTFSNLSCLALTPFTAFEVVARVSDHEHTLRFALNLPIAGIPVDRKAHLFSAIIADRAQFLRYLWVMLVSGTSDPSSWMDWIGKGTWHTWGATFGDTELPLLEALVRALSRSPEKIDRISELVEGLRCTPEGRRVLPEGFEMFWEAVINTRSEMQ